MPEPGDNGDDSPANDGADTPSSDGASDGGDDDPQPQDGGMNPSADDAGEPLPGDDGGSDPDPDPAKPSCGATTTPCVAPEGCTAMDNGGHTYFFCTANVFWDDARAACQAASTDLVIIESEEENMFVAGNISADSFIGINDVDTEETFAWLVPGTARTAGAAPSFTNWAGLQPDDCSIFGDQDCAVLGSDGKWNDVACADGCIGGARPFVCESY